MKLPLSPGAAQALFRLRAAGYESWIVGGCVRDALLGRPPGDYDMTTSARPEETKAVFAGEKVIETGIRHGTVTVVLEGEPLEITTYRVDGGYSDARHPDGVTFTASLREDAARRDFTMNAMAYAPEEGLRDYFGGQEDLKRRLIRCVGDPDRRFREDALRILRALRFASVLGFALEEGTLAAARRQAFLLREISRERVSQELGKLLCGPGAGEVLRTCPDILGQVIPELLPMVGFDQRNEHHCYDLLTHTAVALDHVPPRLPLRLAMLLHDVGKPRCFSLGEDGQGHFYGHAHVGMEMAGEILTRLRFPGKVCRQVETLVRYHDSVLPEDPRLLRRWLRKLGPEGLLDLVAIQRGDTWGLAPAYCTRQEGFDRLEQRVQDVMNEQPCLSVRDLAVKGGDLLALGYRGPAIGEIQRQLLEDVTEGEIPNEKEVLLQYLKSFDAKNKT
ncbi:MAG: HD domain-containing protein [Evtepia sp.]|uniref:CCA tRNA nucleotidyltransferase n=1 Tax=Evtepia sp. TaxID=2773933 RepID=UPI002A763957|nr:HD domain-containing protein [Evtepia sp.]MDY3014561.1 HD domain-containing protein [Evtepia sp.]